MGTPARKSDLTDPQDWATRINAGLGRTVQALIDVGVALISAKNQLPHGEWHRMFPEHPQAVSKPIQFSLRTAQRFMVVARLASKTTDLSRLPPALTVLEAVAKLPDRTFDFLVKSGRMNPELRLKHVKKMRPYRESGGWTNINTKRPAWLRERRVPELPVVPDYYTIEGFLAVARDIAENNILDMEPTQEQRVLLRRWLQNIIDALDGDAVGGEVEFQRETGIIAAAGGGVVN